jgi:ATP-dependent helicase/nuclease subunit A
VTTDDVTRAREADERARAVARSEFERPLLLDAGAGTGKTTAVAARIVAWLVGPGWERAAAALAARRAPAGPDSIAQRAVERVVAITFTDRAAAEMAQRVTTTLAAVHRGEDAIGLRLADLPGSREQLRQRSAALLAAQDRLAVSTIHAYCHRLLAAHALEAGVHPAFEVDAEENRLASVVEEVLARRVPEALGSPADPDWVELAGRGHGPASIAEALLQLAAEATPPEALDDDPLAEARIRAVATELGVAAAQIAGVVRKPLADPKASALRKPRAALDALDRAAAAATRVSTIRELLEVAEMLAGEALAKLKEWSRPDRISGKAESALLAPVAGDLAPAAAALSGLLKSLAVLDPGLLAPARRALRPLLAEVSAELRRRGIATFASLIRDAERLLRQRTVADSVRAGIDQLIVDEFQDTDDLQCAIVRRLALEGPPGQRPGLMLVGDPKQSIYGWRNASLAAYYGFGCEVVAAGGAHLRLSVNFRSQPAILDEVTRIARPLLVEDGDRQAPFQLLVPDLGPANGTRPPVEYWISWPRDRFEARLATGSEQAREPEAHAIAAEIGALRAEGAELGRIAILFRAATALEPYLDALRAHGVPFVVERERSYYRRREVVDAASLVRAIADPLDTLALVAFLRSPWAGLPDAAIPGLWSRGVVDTLQRIERPDAGVYARLDAALDEIAHEVARAAVPGLDRIADWPLAAKAALRTLVSLRHALAEQPADRFVDALMALVLPLETAAARYLGPFRLANLELFLARLLDGLSGAEGIQGVLRELRGGVAEGREAREGAPGDDTLDAVRVLTIHKAKGLDFDHVFVADLHHGSGTPGGRENRAVPRPGGGWNLRLLGASGLGYHEVERAEAEISRAELVRTLYVATTRARVRMVLAGAWPGHGLGPRPPAGPLLALLARREGGDAVEALIAGGGEAVDAHGVPWRILPALDPAALRPGTPAPAEGDTALRAAALDGEYLAVSRQAAAARAARRALATPSGAAHAAERARRDGEDDPDRPDLAPGTEPAPRELRLAVGTAIHRALEAWDLEADPAAERARQRERLAGHLPPDLAPALRDRACTEAGALFDRMAGNGALSGFAALRGRVLGREVPLLAAPDGDADDQPTGAWVGTIDLLYRAEDGALVVVDYKTDALPDAGAADFPAALAAAVERYRPQLARYAESLRPLFPAPPPRAELWFLAAGRVERV